MRKRCRGRSCNLQLAPCTWQLATGNWQLAPSAHFSLDSACGFALRKIKLSACQKLGVRASSDQARACVTPINSLNAALTAALLARALQASHRSSGQTAGINRRQPSPPRPVRRVRLFAEAAWYASGPCRRAVSLRTRPCDAGRWTPNVHRSVLPIGGLRASQDVTAAACH